MRDTLSYQLSRRQWLVAGLAGSLAATGMIRCGAAQTAPPQGAIIGTLVDDVNLHGVEDIHLHGRFAYLPCREGRRLTVCDISAPQKPCIVSSLALPEFSQIPGFALHGDYCYIASPSKSVSAKSATDKPKLWVIDVRDKSRLRPVGSVAVGAHGMLYKTAYRNGFCYMAHYTEKKLYIVDVRRPQKPCVVSRVTIPGEKGGPFSVLLRDHYALVGTVRGRPNCYAVVDIQNPLEPRLLRSLSGPDLGQMSGTVLGDYLYAAAWAQNNFFVVDLSNPANPRIVSRLHDERLGKPNRCAAIADRAYLPMESGNGVAVVDIAKPEKPRFLASYTDPVLMKKTYAVAVRDNLLFVGSRKGNSLVVFDRRKLG
ncbi:MAG: hypothetical protein JXM70_01310 [Pirellulales bacterium]|nr:hypothetical protein [Pirellulales bacterium]